MIGVFSGFSENIIIPVVRDLKGNSNTTRAGDSSIDFSQMSFTYEISYPRVIVFLTTEEEKQNHFKDRINLRLGVPTTLLCYSNTQYWSTSYSYTEVSLYYCNDSNFQQFKSLCKSISQYQPLFGVTRDNSFHSFRYLSNGSALLTQLFQFELPPNPDPVPTVSIRIPVKKVTPMLQGYFFCRISAKPRFDTGVNSSTLIRDSDFIAIKPFGTGNY